MKTQHFFQTLSHVENVANIYGHNIIFSLQYDTTFGKGRNDATKKAEDDKNTSSRITKYGGGYSGNYQRDTSAGKLFVCLSFSTSPTALVNVSKLFPLSTFY